MTVILACGAAFLLAIGFLAFALAASAKGDAYEQQAKDDEQMAALMELRALEALEHDLFADEQAA